MDFEVEKFSYRLNALLEEHNMTQTQLAKIVGTSNVTICRYSTCERTPRLDVITKIANPFNVSIDYLLGNSENRNINISEKTNSDIEMAMIIKDLYNLDKNSHLSKKQIEMIKKLLLANKDFILSA